MSDLITYLLIGVFILVACGIMALAYWHDERMSKMAIELERVQQESQQQTLTMVSREIHDHCLQDLLCVKLTLKGEYEKILGNTIETLRDLTKTLNSDYISETGLYNAIKIQLKLFPLQTSIDLIGEEKKSENDKVLFPIIQELITNIIKHAEASSIHIQLVYAHKLEITITDNGKGFIQGKKGLGLINVEKRIQLINGSVEFGRNSVKVKA